MSPRLIVPHLQPYFFMVLSTSIEHNTSAATRMLLQSRVKHLKLFFKNTLEIFKTLLIIFGSSLGEILNTS